MTHESEVKDLEHYLRLTTMARTALWGQSSLPTQTTEEFVLNYGFKLGPRVQITGRPQGTPRLCFKNAFEMMLSNEHLIYCEGYAMSVIPIMHAWCIDSEGKVYDNTWANKKGEETEYIGVPFDRDWVQNQVEKRGHYGVIDDWHQRWPLLSWKGKPTFLHPDWRDRLTTGLSVTRIDPTDSSGADSGD